MGLMVMFLSRGSPPRGFGRVSAGASVDFRDV